MAVTVQQSQTQTDKIAAEVARMDRRAIIEELLHFQGHFPLDFTPEFLGALSSVRLKHILLAARVQSLRHSD